jgi:hypothetical protein
MIERQGSLKLPDKRGGTALLISLFLILVGSRAALISHAGNPTPFLDEWDADAAGLLKPYLEGRLTVGDLLAPFGEHRILFTRLLVLSIFHVSGYWDVILQMVVNAIVNSAAVVAMSYALSRVLWGSWAITAMIVCAAINAVPYGYDAILFGFHTQFFFLNAFSFGSLWLLAGSKAWSPRWAAGVLAALAAYLSMASGALTPAAAAAAHLLQAACGRRGGLREALGIAVLGAMTVNMLALIPHPPASGAYRAHSVGQFLSAFVQLASWPAQNALGLILFAPSALFLTRALADRPGLSDPRWLNLATLAWVLGQIVALALGRAEGPNQTRYIHLLLVGSMINLVSAFWLFQSGVTAGKRATWPSLVLTAWLGVFALWLTQPQRHLPGSIEEWRTITAAGANNVRHYLATGDISFLSGAPILQIPYSETGRLRELLDAPEIRSALPPELLPRNPPRPWVEVFKQGFLRLGFVWLGLGALILAAVIARAAFIPRKLGSHGLARGDPLAG